MGEAAAAVAEAMVAAPKVCSGVSVVSKSWESWEDWESATRGRRLLEAIYALKLPTTEADIAAKLSGDFSRGEVWVALSHLRRHGFLRTLGGDVLPASAPPKEDGSTSDDTNSLKVARARNLTSLSGAVSEEAKKWAEQCRFEEIAAHWDAQTAKAAGTWAWNISQTLPFTDHLFELAREGRFSEIDECASEAVAVTLRAWCWFKADDWKRRRAERSVTFDDKRRKTVFRSLRQLKGQTTAWMLEVADGGEDATFDAQRVDLVDCVDMDDLAAKIDRALARRSESCLKRFLAKHDPVPIAPKDQDLKETLTAVATREIPDEAPDEAIPGRDASEYVARARRRRLGGKKRSFASSRAPSSAASRRSKPPACAAFALLPPPTTQSVPWAAIVAHVDQPIEVPRKKLCTPQQPHARPHLPAPAVRKLDKPYSDNRDDDHANDQPARPRLIDPDVMLQSHEAVLAAMKLKMDKLLQDAKQNGGHGRGTPRNRS